MTILTKDTIDSSGRQLMLDNSVLGVHFYDYGADSWDRLGTSNQSWVNELYLPNDFFDTFDISSDKWVNISNVSPDNYTISQENSLELSIIRSEGIVGLSSNSKWKLSGDFELRLYLDWPSYYNEYRSITHSFLRISYDNSNAVRVSFTFDGEDGFSFTSEKIVARNLQYFDWRANGSPLNVVNISAAQEFTHLKIKRISGIIYTYASTPSDDTLVGLSVDDSVFSGDVYVDIGLENKEYNTYSHNFSKFSVSGEAVPNTQFFSPHRGPASQFPEKVIFVVDSSSISIIDESNYSLWSRILIGSSSVFGGVVPKVYFSNGVLYCSTDNGVLAYDFHSDKIYKYIDNNIYVSDESIALRNTSLNFSTYQEAAGSLPSNKINNVYARILNGWNIFAAATDEGVFVKRALTPALAYSTSGVLPSTKVIVSDSWGIYWSGFDSDDESGSLSSYSNMVSILNSLSASSFSSDTTSTTTSTLPIFGSNITDFDIKTVSGDDQILVGTTEGLTFISKAPGAFKTESISYGLAPSTVENPFSDPSFENYIGLDWVPETNALVSTFFYSTSSDFSTDSENSLKLNFTHSSAGGTLSSGTYGGVYQNVDLTGVNFIYYDAHLTDAAGSNANKNHWNLLFLVDDVIVKSHKDSDGTIDLYNNYIDVSSFTGIHKFRIQIRMITTTNSSILDSKFAYIDNLRISFGDPDYGELPPGQSSLKEVLLQYEENVHKAYFSTAGGYGALDLDGHSLDYFIPIGKYVPGAEVLSSDFSRTENES